MIDWIKLRANFRDLVAISKDAELQLLATSMTYVSLLSLVPLFGLVIWILSVSGNLEQLFQNSIKPLLIEYLAVGVEQKVSTAMNMLVKGFHSRLFNLSGVVMLIFSSMMLLRDMDHAIQKIWQLRKKRPFLQRFLSYGFIVLLSPILLILTKLFLMSDYVHFIFRIPMLSTGVVLCFLALFSIYKWAPNRKVNSAAAAIAAFVVVILLSLGQLLYGWMTRSVFHYDRVYGSFAFVPIFMIWLQFLWGLFLLGVALTATLEKRRTLRSEVTTTPVIS